MESVDGVPTIATRTTPEKFENAAFVITMYSIQCPLLIRLAMLFSEFIFRVRPIVHTNPSRQRSFSKKLCKRELFENGRFAF